MPSLPRSGAGVVYQATVIDSNIWELRLPSSPNSQAATDERRVIASTSSDGDMRLSPDGTRIAFESARSGHSDLWVSNRDGSQARQLTNFGGWRAGSPCWSADGTSIAFDAIEPGGNWSLYVVAADGSPISKPLISDRYNNVRPAWSLDGKWIYFASDRTGDYQIWKMPLAGGTLVQITRNGGLDSIVSPDGRHLYYAKSPPVQGIWDSPVRGRPRGQGRRAGPVAGVRRHRHGNLHHGCLCEAAGNGRDVQLRLADSSFPLRGCPRACGYPQALTSPSRAMGARCCTCNSISGRATSRCCREFVEGDRPRPSSTLRES